MATPQKQQSIPVVVTKLQPAPQAPIEAVGIIRTHDGIGAMRIRATAYEVLERSEPNLLIVARDYVSRYVHKLLGGS